MTPKLRSELEVRLSVRGDALEANVMVGVLTGAAWLRGCSLGWVQVLAPTPWVSVRSCFTHTGPWGRWHTTSIYYPWPAKYSSPSLPFSCLASLSPVSLNQRFCVSSKILTMLLQYYPQIFSTTDNQTPLQLGQAGESEVVRLNQRHTLQRTGTSWSSGTPD